MTNLAIGQRVKTKPGIARLYEGTPWEAKFQAPRGGTIEQVPWFARQNGYGTLYVRFDSLTGSNADDANWCRWMHSDRLEVLA
jgi:hypothetical protein